ncbi:envelope stress response membrane protein PspB [Asaia sp. W19]|uniref:envelope stress response membrane protein PspB n=1 Tax=unclassified Asaia TaxID=2685023 RepID=UPI000F8DADB7|nr:envelope stress response membrane protein PspB [Asaia sp. W19]RUT24390.1 envelope stress response membrane protein PspB [Asaia sp. W19]
MDDFIGLAAVVLFFVTIMYIATIRSRSRATASKLQESDLAALNMAHVQARRLEERVDQLERILDEDVPGWRTRSFS